MSLGCSAGKVRELCGDGGVGAWVIQGGCVCKIGLVQFLQAMFSVHVERDSALEANMQTAQLFVLVAPGLAELYLSSPDVSVRCTK